MQEVILSDRLTMKTFMTNVYHFIMFVLELIVNIRCFILTLD